MQSEIKANIQDEFMVNDDMIVCLRSGLSNRSLLVIVKFTDFSFIRLWPQSPLAWALIRPIFATSFILTFQAVLKGIVSKSAEPVVMGSLVSASFTYARTTSICETFSLMEIFHPGIPSASSWQTSVLHRISGWNPGTHFQ
jgi:hypothetical protein